MIDFDLEGSRVVLRAEERDATVLKSLVEQLTELLGSRRTEPTFGKAISADPALARLFPDPVAGDEFASADLRSLTESSLLNRKLESAHRLTASLEQSAPLDAEQELAWLRTLTDLRLVIATRLGILEDGDEGATSTEGERWMQAAYHWLGATQMRLIDVLDARDEETAMQATDLET